MISELVTASECDRYYLLFSIIAAMKIVNDKPNIVSGQYMLCVGVSIR